MKFIEKLYGWYGKKTVISVAGGVLMVVVIGITQGGGTTTDAVVERLPVVEITDARGVQTAGALSFVGTVRSVSEVEIIPERGGKVVSVPVTLGSNVRAGDILFTLENASERAQVLQAEGSYDAAVANASLSTISVREAELKVEDATDSLLTASQNVYTTLSNTVYSTIDRFYSNPRGSYPGVRIETAVSSDVLRNERITLESTLATWQPAITPTHIQYAENEIERTLFLVDAFLTALSDTKNIQRYTPTEISDLNKLLVAARQALVSTEGALQTANKNLETAREALIRAQSSTGGGASSVADAQVKQALGALNQARASLAKTIVRAPIPGVVNTLEVEVGDTVSSAGRALTLANNSQLEIITYASEKERALLTLGQEVTLDRKATGTISVIAPAIDTKTGKIEVRIVTENTTITNGTTVRIDTAASQEAVETEVIQIPLTAVKLSGENGSILVVNDDGVLEARPVALGAVRSGTVVIESGLAIDQVFVLDARGLSAGEKVIIKQ